MLENLILDEYGIDNIFENILDYNEDMRNSMNQYSNEENFKRNLSDIYSNEDLSFDFMDEIDSTIGWEPRTIEKYVELIIDLVKEYDNKINIKTLIFDNENRIGVISEESFKEDLFYNIFWIESSNLISLIYSNIVLSISESLSLIGSKKDLVKYRHFMKNCYSKIIFNDL